jgi:calcineurin-like phosphoesterase family protein
LLGAQYGTEGKIEGHEDYYEDTKKYKEYIEQGKFLLLVHGPKTEVEKAQMILKEHSGNIVLHNHIAIM